MVELRRYGEWKWGVWKIWKQMILFWATSWVLGLLSEIVIVRGEMEFWGSILVFRYFAFDMLLGHPGGCA